MAGEQKHSHVNPLEQFILLAPNAKGSALISLINQLLEAPGVYVFGEFLELPCVQELSKGPNNGYSQLLNMFAYGTYHDYKAYKDSLPPLSEAQKNKLRHLTIVSLAANMQCIPYSVLLKELELGSLRQLEDLIIDAVYAEAIRGKLDQCRQQLEVDACVGRDIRAEGTADLLRTLTQWCASCESVSEAIEVQVSRVSQFRESHLKARQQVETEVGNIQKIMTASTASVDQPGEQEGAKASTERRPPLKKISKGKTPTP